MRDDQPACEHHLRSGLMINHSIRSFLMAVEMCQSRALFYLPLLRYVLCPIPSKLRSLQKALAYRFGQSSTTSIKKRCELSSVQMVSSAAHASSSSLLPSPPFRWMKLFSCAAKKDRLKIFPPCDLPPFTQLKLNTKINQKQYVLCLTQKFTRNSGSVKGATR